MRADFDIAILGSGFAGSLLALIARRLGRSVVLVERARHPRFAIGESSTPLANLLLEELALRYDLPRLLPLTKWGSWRRDYPHIACGLKRGFTFFHHEPGRPFTPRADRANELLVAASPHDGVADTHWFRAEFDAFLAAEARALGAELLEETQVIRVEMGESGARLEVTNSGGSFTLRAGLLFDATGPRGALHRALGLGEAALEGMPATQGLYAHFTGVAEHCGVRNGERGMETPYPAQAAAVHHVFPGGWAWVLRFANGVTSAGVAAVDAVSEELRFAEGAAAWERLLARLPSLGEEFAQARVVGSFHHARRLPFLSAQGAGARWALLPSAAGFVDPLLSTGFPLTLLGVSRLARGLEEGAVSFEDYARRTAGELQSTARLVGALYAAMGDAELFGALARLYFAAASFTETMRRLGRGGEAGEAFLLAEHRVFGPRCVACVAMALARPQGAERARLLADIREAIAPVDLAGLGDATRRNWHPCRAEDLFAAAERIGATRAELEAMLARTGFGGQGIGEDR